MKNRTLGIRKFDSILLASSVEMIVSIILDMTDTAVAGHIVGMTALSAMNVIAPILAFTIFTENLFSVGTSMLYAKRAGEYRTLEAEKTFGMGLMMSAFTGVLTYLAVTLILPGYLDYMGVQDQIRQCVMTYMTFLKIDLMLSPVYEVINLLITTDGDEYLSMSSNIARPVLNILLSIWLGLRYGITGIGIGTVVSTVIAFLILTLHFFSRRSSLRPRLHFSLADLKSMLVFAWNDSAMFFILPLVCFLITKLVIARCGEFWLPVLTVLFTVIEMTSVFEATGEAMRPILPIYLGDRNNTAILRLTKHSRRVNQFFGLLFSAVLLIAADWIPLAFDIQDAALLAVSARGMRIYALCCPVLSELTLINSYYLNTGKPGIATLEMLLVQLVCPLALVVPLLLLVGIDGIFMGYACAAYLSLLILGLVIRARFGRNGFPYYLPESTGALFFQEVALDEGHIGAFVSQIGAFLSENRVPTPTARRVELACEETLLLIRDRNGKKTVQAECFLRAEPEGVTLSLWDSGEIFDLTDEDGAISSFRSYFVARMLSRIQVKKHMVATSFNRNSFFFPAKKPEDTHPRP